MTIEEFSNEFDSYINAFGEINSITQFDEYEKSIFLTQAQELIVTSLYNGTLKQIGFEETEELRRYLNDLVKTKVYNKEDQIEGNPLSSKSVFYNVDDDVLFITCEEVILSSNDICMDGKTIEVIPVTQDDYHRTKDNPFKGPNKRRALRLDTEGMVEIISNYNIDKYIMRYLSKPSPIILIDLEYPLSINKESNITECKLNPALHRTILEMAVKLAIASKNVGK